jgi:hypothetical protein
MYKELMHTLTHDVQPLSKQIEANKTERFAVQQFLRMHGPEHLRRELAIVMKPHPLFSNLIHITADKWFSPISSLIVREVRLHSTVR